MVPEPKLEGRGCEGEIPWAAARGAPLFFLTLAGNCKSPYLVFICYLA